jgi:hypothetical protein
MDMFILRQALASTIIAISVYFLAVHESKKALFCLAISPLFHVLSLIAIPVLFIFRLKPPRTVYLGLLVISMCIGIFGLGGIMSELAVSILGTDSFIGDKIYRYSVGSRADATGVIRFSTLIILSTLTFVILFLSDKYRDRKFYVILNTSIYAFLILVLLNDIGIFGDRGYRMVAFPLMLIFPYISLCFAKRYHILINYIIFTGFLVLSVFFINASYISWLC